MRSVVSPEVRWLGRQVLPLMRLNLLGLLSIVAASVLTLLDPLIIKWLIDEALAKGSVELLLLGAIGFGAAYFGQLAFSYATYLVGFVVSQKMIFRIDGLSYSLRYFDRGIVHLFGQLLLLCMASLWLLPS